MISNNYGYSNYQNRDTSGINLVNNNVNNYRNYQNNSNNDNNYPTERCDGCFDKGGVCFCINCEKIFCKICEDQIHVVPINRSHERYISYYL